MNISPYLEFARRLSGRTVTLIYGDDEIEAIKGTVKKSKELAYAGLGEKYDFSVWIDTATYTSIPQAEEFVEIDGTTYRVAALDDQTTQVRLDLKEEHS